MTDTSPSPDLGARVTSPPVRSRTEPTGWVGWIVFAAVMLIMVGLLHAIEGFVALFKDSYYLVASSGLVVNVDYTGWGWLHLILGLAVAATGAALFTGCNQLLAAWGARHRKRADPELRAIHRQQNANNGAALAVGALIDGIPESIVIGVSLLEGGYSLSGLASAAAAHLEALL